MIQRLRFSGGQVIFQNDAVGNHRIAAAAVQFDDANRDFAFQISIKIVGWPNLDLRTGQKGDDADIDRQAAFDLADDAARYGRALGRRFFELVPNLDAMSPLIGKQDVAFDRFAGAIEHDFDHVTGLHGGRAVHQRELGSGDKPLCFATDIYNDFFIRHAEHVSVKNLALVSGELAIVVVKKRLILGIVSCWRLDIFVRWTGHV